MLGVILGVTLTLGVLEIDILGVLVGVGVGSIQVDASAQLAAKLVITAEARPPVQPAPVQG